MTTEPISHDGCWRPNVRLVVTAFDILLAIPIAAFGIWRIAAGLSRLELIDRQVPGADFFVRSLPSFVRAPRGVSGVGDLIGGSMFVLFALLLALTHPSS
jgi:hypothetical protein